MIAFVTAFMTGPAVASDPDSADALLLADTLQRQLTEQTERLALPDAPPIYHLRYHLVQLGQVDVTASLGEIVAANALPWSVLGVEVRIGEPSFDNTGFGGWQNGFARATLPVELSERALELAAWRLTDGAYKEAVEQYARKEAQFSPPDDHPGDYTLTGAVRTDRGAAEADTRPDRLAELAVTLSQQLVGEVALEVGEVLVGHEAGSVLTVDSEGTRVRRPYAETTIRAAAHLRTSDGMLLTDHRLWTERSVEALPAPEQMGRDVAALRSELVELADAAPLAEEYVGPVIFEASAAADLFRYVLVPQLEGTPSEVPFDSFFGELGGNKDPVRLGRRVLPPGWGVRDDPTRLWDHPGAFTHDWEGTPAQPVDAVTDGIVRQLLMSRVPRAGTSGTNGHGRGFVGRRAEGRASLLEVTPDRSRSASALRRRAMRLARAYGRDWVLVVRRLQEPAVLGLDPNAPYYDPRDAGTPLPPPMAVVRLFADGREEVLRGARFASVQRWILRDIVAAGAQIETDYLAPASGSYGGIAATEGMPSRVRAPAVLVGEVEIVPAPGDNQARAAYPPPPLP